MMKLKLYILTLFTTLFGGTLFVNIRLQRILNGINASRNNAFIVHENQAYTNITSPTISNNDDINNNNNKNKKASLTTDTAPMDAVATAVHTSTTTDSDPATTTDITTINSSSDSTTYQLDKINVHVDNAPTDTTTSTTTSTTDTAPMDATPTESVTTTDSTPTNIDSSSDSTTYQLSKTNVDVDQPKKKNLYFHTGPGKMGTSTIQVGFIRDKSENKEDGLCTYDARLLFVGTVTVKSLRSSKYWEKLQSRLDECYQMNQHVILSSEMITRMEAEAWETLLEPLFSRWNVIHLLGYRRYYEWTASLYGQHIKGTTGTRLQAYKQPLHDFLRSSDGSRYTKSQLIGWKSLSLHDPEVNDITVEEVKEQIRIHSQGQQRQQRQQLDKYEFQIYNMHEDKNVLKTLYCNVIPFTYKTCEKHTNNAPPKDNTASPREYYRLILAGIDENKVTGLKVKDRMSNKYTQATNQLKQLWEEDLNKTIMDFPKDCPSKEDVQLMFDEQMAIEQLLVPDYFEKEVQPHMDQRKQDFYDMVAAKFCGVDLEKVVNGEEYVQLWERLDNIISK